MIKTRIKYISIILSIFLMSTSCHYQPLFGSRNNYDWFINYLDLPNLWKIVTGKNVTVAVIDSGINYDILGTGFDTMRIVAEYSAIDESDDMSDSTLHGTAMINIIGATGNHSLYGVAPDCNFVIIKALNSVGSTNSEILERAIRFAIEKRVDIINLSVGGNSENDSLTKVIRLALQSNIAVVCSAGDYGKEGAIFPAKLNECLSVAAIDNNGLPYEKSNFGENIDLYCPGVEIETARFDYMGKITYTKKSGSSIATAVATGIVALYMEFLKEYSVSDIYETLREMKGQNINLIFKTCKIKSSKINEKF